MRFSHHLPEMRVLEGTEKVGMKGRILRIFSSGDSSTLHAARVQWFPNSGSGTQQWVVIQVLAACET